MTTDTDQSDKQSADESAAGDAASTATEGEAGNSVAQEGAMVDDTRDAETPNAEGVGAAEGDDGEDDNGKDDESLRTEAQVEELPGCQRRIKATVSHDIVKREFDKSYKELSDVVQLPGFRRGRVPRALLESRYGEELEKDLKDMLLQKSFSEVLEREELDVVGEPDFEDIEFTADGPFEYVVNLELKPTFELPKYKGIEVDRHQEPVSDEALTKRIDDLRNRTASFEPVGLDEVKPEDRFQGSYTLLRDGEAVTSGEAVGFEPASNRIGSFDVPDLAEKVAATKFIDGDTMKVPVTVPPHYSEEVLRGAEVELEFTLSGVRRRTLPEVDDAWAENVGSESLEDLKSTLRDTLVAQNAREADSAIEEKILDQLYESVTIELPSTLFEKRCDRVQDDRGAQLKSEGLSDEEVDAKLKEERSDVEQNIRKELTKAFVVDAIADREKVFVTERDLDDHLEQMGQVYGISRGDLRDQLRSRGQLEEIRESLRSDKVLKFLRKKAQITQTGDGSEASATEEESNESNESDAV